MRSLCWSGRSGSFIQHVSADAECSLVSNAQKIKEIIWWKEIL